MKASRLTVAAATAVLAMRGCSGGEPASSQPLPSGNDSPTVSLPPPGVVVAPNRLGAQATCEDGIRKMYHATGARFTQMNAEARGNDGLWNVRGTVNGDFFQCQAYWSDGVWHFWDVSGVTRKWLSPIPVV